MEYGSEHLWDGIIIIRQSVEMQRIQRKNNRFLKETLTNFFISPSRTPEVLEELAVLSQLVIFTTVAFRIADLPTYFIFRNKELASLIFLLLSLVLKACFRLTYIRSYYLLCLMWVQNSYDRSVDFKQEALALFTLFLTVFNIVLDVLSRIEFSFETSNPQSETINHCKWLHYLVMGVSVGLFANEGNYFGEANKWPSHLICLLLLALLIFVKAKSVCRSFLIKGMLMRFYFLFCFCYLRNIIKEFVPAKAPLVVEFILVVSISQVLFALINSKFQKIQIDTEISNGMTVELVFKLLSYYYGSEYDPEYQKVLTSLGEARADDWANDELRVIKPLIREEISDKDDDERSENNKNSLNHEKEMVSSQLGSSSPSTMNLLLHISDILKAYEVSEDSSEQKTFIKLLEVQILMSLEKNLIKAYEALVIAKRSCQTYSLIQRLCIFKLETRLSEEIEFEFNRNGSPLFNEFLANEKLRVEIIKNSYEYLSLWETLSHQEVVFSKLQALASKVIRRKDKIDSLYSSIDIKCASITRSYIDYLNQVRRDVELANKASRDFEIFEENQHHLNIERKLYVSIVLTKDSLMTIEKVGYNVKKLLGYERSDVMGANVSLLLPAFYRKIHEEAIQERVLKFNNHDLYLFKKDVVARHCEEFYLPCSVELKLVYNCEGEILLEGFMEIKPNPKYYWSNFFFVKSESEELVEVGPALRDIIELTSGKIVYYSEYFENECPVSQNNFKDEAEEKTYKQSTVSKEGQIKYMIHEGSVYEYQLMSRFPIFNEASPSQHYSLYICRAEPGLEGDLPEAFGLAEFYMEYMKHFLTFQKFPVKFEDFETNINEFLQEKAEIQKAISGAKIKTLIVVTLACLMSCFGVKAYSIVSIFEGKRSQDESGEYARVVLDHYNNLSQLAMIDNEYKYTQMLGYPSGHEASEFNSLIITLQQTNKRLERFGTKRFGPTVASSAKIFPKTLTQFIEEVLSNIYLNIYTLDMDLIPIAMNNIHSLYISIFDGFSQEYIASFTDYVVLQSQREQTKAYAIVALTCALLLATVILIFCMESEQRYHRFMVINAFSNINSSKLFIKSIHAYLGAFSGGVSQKDYMSSKRESSHDLKGVKDTMESRRLDNSVIYSSRENSARGILEEADTKVALETFSSMEEKQREMKLQEEQKKRLKVKRRSRKFVIFWAISTLISIGLPLCHFLYFKLSGDIVFGEGVNKMFMIYEKFLTFSDLTVSYTDGILYQDAMLEVFQHNLNRFRALEEKEMIFDEIKLREFKAFKDIYQKMNYVYLCSYNQCDPTFEPYVNILYSTTIHKLIAYMQTHISRDPILNYSYPLRALFYAHPFLRQVANNVIEAYLSCLELYEDRKRTQKVILHYVEIVVLCGWIVCLLWLYLVTFRRQKHTNLQILDLVKKESYVVEEEDQF